MSLVQVSVISATSVSLSASSVSILYLWMLDIAPGCKVRYVLSCLMLSESSFSSQLE